MTRTHILPFTAPERAPAAELDTVGGKGLSSVPPPSLHSSRRQSTT